MDAADELREFRADIARATLQTQQRCQESAIPPDDVIPEIVTTLIDLAAFLQRHSSTETADDFLRTCMRVASLTWAGAEEVPSEDHRH